MSADEAQAPGGTVSTESRLLETGAGMIQDFAPVKQICAHLNAFHVYADDPKRFVETNHYCTHLTDDVRQCLLYDSPKPNARLIGIEYMITPKIFETLDAQERKLWHTHVYEVKSGMLIMPGPTMPGLRQVWETAETEEMEQVVHLYGKIYHLWQTDRGDTLPLGEPKLMTSFTADGQFPNKDQVIGERDARFGTDFKHKADLRKHIEEPKLHPDADATWKTGKGKEL